LHNFLLGAEVMSNMVRVPYRCCLQPSVLQSSATPPGDVTTPPESTTRRRNDRGRRAWPAGRRRRPRVTRRRPAAASRDHCVERSSRGRWDRLARRWTTPRGTRWPGCRRRRESSLHLPSCCRRCPRTRCVGTSDLSTSDARHTVDHSYWQASNQGRITSRKLTTTVLVCDNVIPETYQCHWVAELWLAAPSFFLDIYVLN